MASAAENDRQESWARYKTNSHRSKDEMLLTNSRTRSVIDGKLFKHKSDVLTGVSERQRSGTARPRCSIWNKSAPAPLPGPTCSPIPASCRSTVLRSLKQGLGKSFGLARCQQQTALVAPKNPCRRWTGLTHCKADVIVEALFTVVGRKSNLERQVVVGLYGHIE